MSDGAGVLYVKDGLEVRRDDPDHFQADTRFDFLWEGLLFFAVLFIMLMIFLGAFDDPSAGYGGLSAFAFVLLSMILVKKRVSLDVTPDSLTVEEKHVLGIGLGSRFMAVSPDLVAEVKRAVSSDSYDSLGRRTRRGGGDLFPYYFVVVSGRGVDGGYGKVTLFGGYSKKQSDILAGKINEMVGLKRKSLAQGPGA